jgi:hypothetical protein
MNTKALALAVLLAAGIRAEDAAGTKTNATAAKPAATAPVAAATPALPARTASQAMVEIADRDRLPGGSRR